MFTNKLYVDDVRKAPEGWTQAFNYTDAVSILSTQPIHYLSLDHDLGENRPTGYDIAKWMVENNVWPKHIFLHTMNPVGRDNIKQLLRKYAPEGVFIV